MAYLLSTGTTMTVAAATGDAGQLGMAAGFERYSISLLITHRDTFHGGAFRGGAFHGTDLCRGDGFRGDLGRGALCRGDRFWGDLSLGFRQFLGLGATPGHGLSAFSRPGAYLSGRYWHPFFQHFVFQR
jgi:hypothetical protein